MEAASYQKELKSIDLPCNQTEHTKTISNNVKDRRFKKFIYIYIYRYGIFVIMVILRWHFEEGDTELKPLKNLLRPFEHERIGLVNIRPISTS